MESNPDGGQQSAEYNNLLNKMKVTLAGLSCERARVCASYSHIGPAMIPVSFDIPCKVIVGAETINNRGDDAN